ncbi:hypothetical protein [Senegalia massiliensis]|nr:hypothetical protein [Senegalia massiliensis]
MFLFCSFLVFVEHKEQRIQRGSKLYKKAMDNIGGMKNGMVKKVN